MSKRVTLEQLPKELEKLRKQLKEKTERAMRRTASDAVAIIRPRTPKAFGELSNSIHAGAISAGNTVAQTVVSAPHASAVEIGSRPHKPDFEALLKWVKLRGLQGLTKSGKVRNRFSKSEGPTTPRQARGVAQELKGLEVRGTRKNGRHSPIDAPEVVARRISNAIEKGGTKPHWYVRDSIPEIEEKLAENITRALGD